MKATYEVRPGLSIEVEGATQADLFRELSGAVEVFGETHCGECGEDTIVPICRTAQENEFFEWACLNPKCGARLSMGVRKDKSGRLFPNRKLLPGGKPDWQHGTAGSHNGWTTFRGDANTGNGGPKTPAPQRSAPASAGGPPTPAPQPSAPATATVTSTVQSPGYQAPTRAQAGAPISAAQWDTIQDALRQRFISPAAFLTRYEYKAPRDIKAADFDELLHAAQNPDDELRAAQKSQPAARRASVR